MFRRFSVNFAVLSIFLDIVLIALALFISSAARMPLNILPFVQEIPNPVKLPWVLYFVFPLIWVCVLMLFSVYDGRKNFRAVDEFASLTLGTALAAIAMAGILYFLYRDVSRFLFLIFVFLTYAFLLTLRAVYRFADSHIIFGGIQSRLVLILGAGDVGRNLQEQILKQPRMGLKPVGFLDDDLEKQRNQADVLGSLDKVREVVNQKKIEDIVIALPRPAYARLNEIVSELYDLPVRVWIILNYFSLTLHKASLEEVAGIPLIDLRASALSEYQRMLKRTLDLFLIILILPFVIPLMGVIALAIRLDSPGSVIYKPLRVGENGRLFEMYKFRTMVGKADQLLHMVERKDEHGQVIHKIRNDPRVTRVGRILRRTSLDELPQIINVLQGRMSIVGPRPEQPHLVEKYDLWQRTRFAVPQGITGWWQVTGRSDKPMHLHTEEDLYYVQHYSIWLDLQILFRTIWVVIQGRGAF